MKNTTLNHEERYIKLGLNIAYYRKLRGLTQMQLAERIDVSRTHLSNIEAPNVPTSISLETLFNIADALEIPVYYFFDFKEELPAGRKKTPEPDPCFQSMYRSPGVFFLFPYFMFWESFNGITAFSRFPAASAWSFPLRSEYFHTRYICTDVRRAVF